jgi:peroxiredoxin
LRDHYPAFRELIAEVLAISASGLKPLAKFARSLALPFPVLSDAKQEACCALGLGNGLALHPRTPFEFAWLVWREGRVHRPASGLFRTGGDFTVDAAGMLRYVHYSEGPADRPTAAELLRRTAASTSSSNQIEKQAYFP